ncbi:MAG TPA: hypothetical protein PLP05_12670 [Sedimentisphaerales bacterium]|nr:hypothetical protein [Sedimentisphaerales bacterium]
MDLCWLNTIWPICQDIAGENASGLYEAFQQDERCQDIRRRFMQGQIDMDEIRQVLKDLT